MIQCLGRQFPVPVSHRVLAVNFNSCNTVIGDIAVTETKFSVQVDLDQSSHMSFLGLMKLLIAPSTGMLSVVEFVKGVPENSRDSVAGGIELIQLRLHHV